MSEMTDEEINLAVAEEMGWRQVECPGGWGDAPNYPWRSPDGIYHGISDDCIPAYASDLNCCLELIGKARESGFEWDAGTCEGGFFSRFYREDARPNGDVLRKNEKWADGPSLARCISEAFLAVRKKNLK